ncbi:unnamed protein product, partial [Peniophora sp. CBMAI 1063]
MSTGDPSLYQAGKLGINLAHFDINTMPHLEGACRSTGREYPERSRRSAQPGRTPQHKPLVPPTRARHRCLSALPPGVLISNNALTSLVKNGSYASLYDVPRSEYGQSLAQRQSVSSPRAHTAAAHRVVLASAVLSGDTLLWIGTKIYSVYTLRACEQDRSYFTTNVSAPTPTKPGRPRHIHHRWRTTWKMKGTTFCSCAHVPAGVGQGHAYTCAARSRILRSIDGVLLVDGRRCPRPSSVLLTTPFTAGIR